MAGEKKYLLDIKHELDITSIQIYHESLVPLPSIYKVEVGGAVDDTTAQKVIDAVNTLTGQNLTLDDIHLNLSPDEQAYRNTYPSYHTK